LARLRLLNVPTCTPRRLDIILDLKLELDYLGFQQRSPDRHLINSW